MNEVTFSSFVHEMEKISKADLEKEAFLRALLNARRAATLERMAAKSGRALTEAEQTAIAATKLRGPLGKGYRGALQTGSRVPVEGGIVRSAEGVTKMPGTEIQSLKQMVRARKAYIPAPKSSWKLPPKSSGPAEEVTAVLKGPPPTVDPSKRVWTPSGGKIRRVSAQQLRQATVAPRKKVLGVTVGRRQQPSIPKLIKKQKPSGTMAAAYGPSKKRVQSGASAWS
jgi:hypothetical protein